MERSVANPGPGAQLLLLEFVTHERWVYHSRYYPFFKGAAEQLGFDVRWLCFGAEITVEKVSEQRVRQYVALSPSERATLEAELRDHPPSHLILSHPVSSAVQDIFSAASPAPEILSVSDHPVEPPAVAVFEFIRARRERETPSVAADVESLAERYKARADWFLAWLGAADVQCAGLERYLVDAFTPSYDAVMANARAREVVPHLIVLGGVACDHVARVSANEHYRGLSLEDCDQTFGCSYCTWYRGATSAMNRDPVVVAEGQLRRAMDTSGVDGRFRGVIDLLDARLLRRLGDFFEMVLTLDLPPTRFCFEPRVDRFLEISDELAAALERVAPAGHSVELFRMGAENLVDEENARFNKGITLAQIDRARLRLAELAAAFPETFVFDPNLGYISCTPWTTLEMLRLGIERAIERGFAPLDVWLYTPLLFFKRAPITCLAEAEGDVLVDAFEDLSLLYEASVNQVSFDVLEPWRFKDSRTTEAFALIVRFSATALRGKYSDSIFDGDALYEQLVSSASAALVNPRPDLFALHVIDQVQGATPPYDRSALLEAALETLAAAEPGEEAARSANSAEAPAQRDERVERLLAVALERSPEDYSAVSDLRVSRDRRLGRLDLSLKVAGRPCRLTLAGPTPGARAWFSTRHFAVVHDKATPPLGADHALLEGLVRRFDQVLTRYAPALVPSSSEADASSSRRDVTE